MSGDFTIWYVIGIAAGIALFIYLGRIVTDWWHSIEYRKKLAVAQIELLMAIAKKQGVEEDDIDAILQRLRGR